MRGGFFPESDRPIRDRERFFRFLGVAGLLATAAGMLLAVGIAAGALVFKRMEASATWQEADPWLARSRLSAPRERTLP